MSSSTPKIEAPSSSFTAFLNPSTKAAYITQGKNVGSLLVTASISETV
jgi:hypothetical protein